MATTQRMAALAALTGMIATATAAQLARQPSGGDADRDGISDALEAKLGTDPGAAEKLQVVYEDGQAGVDDQTCGSAIKQAHDVIRVWFGNVARNRWLWRFDCAREFIPTEAVAFILYIDADDDPQTGREAGGVQSTDLMLRSSGAQAFGPIRERWPRSAAAWEGTTLYYCLQAPLNQRGGRTSFRAFFLSQTRGEGNEQDRDSSPWFRVEGFANSDREAAAVPEGHRMYLPPQELSHVAAHTFLDGDGAARVHLTWITSWVTKAAVEFGPSTAYGTRVETGRAARNHRVVLEGLPQGRTFHFRIVAPAAEKDITSSDLTFSTAPPKLHRGTVARKQVRLSVENPTQRELADWPITMGMPFQQGQLTRPQAVRLLDPRGREVPLQLAVTARWKDGSIKWALLDFQADLPASGNTQYRLEFGEQVSRKPLDTPLRVQDAGGGGVEVDTGTLRFRVAAEHFGMLEGVWLHGERVTQAWDIRLAAGDGTAYASTAPPEQLVLEERGPQRVVILVRGHHTDGRGRRLFNYTLRIHAYAGKSFLRVFHTFGNDSAGQQFTSIRSLSLWSSLGDGATGTLDTGDGRPPLRASGSGVRLFQDLDDHFAVTADGKAAGEGRRATPVATLRRGPVALSVGVRNFWRLYPKAIGIDERGVTVELLPPLREDQYAAYAEDEDKLYYAMLRGRYKLKGGLEKTHELIYAFHAADETDPDGALAALQNPPLGAAPPAWYCSSGAFDEITPAADGEFPVYEEMVASAAAAMLENRELQKEYGLLNYGDWYGERTYNWGNMEYDTPHCFFTQFARTGNRLYFRLAEAAARHNIDVDFVHYAEDELDVGTTYAHCIGHVGDYYPAGHRPGATPRGSYGRGHAWNRGSFEYYFLTGDRRGLEIAMQFSDMQAVRETLKHRVSGAERATAWPLIAAITAYRATYDELYLNAARLIVDAVVAQQTPAGHWNIPAGYSKLVPKPIGGYAWCSGLLLTGLEMYYDETGEQRAAKAAIRAAEWLARDEWRPDCHGFRATSCETFNNPAPGGACWRVAPGFGFVYELTKDRKFLDIALDGFSHAVYRARAAGSGRGLGKGVSTHLVHSPFFIADLERAGITKLLVPRTPASLWVPRSVVVVRGEAAKLVVRAAGGDEPEEVATIALGALPDGWTANRTRGTLSLTGTGETSAVAFVLTPTRGAGQGSPATVELTVSRAGKMTTQPVRLSFVERREYGTAVGLIAAADDYLGPALQAAGVAFERIERVDAELSKFGVIWVGTQACTLDAAGMASKRWRLAEYVLAGGTLALSQMNDSGWQPDVLRLYLRVADEESSAATIAAPEHAIFNRPHRISSMPRVTSYDTIVAADERWSVLARDHRGQPAILEARCGHGHVFVFEPSFERPEATKAGPEALGLFENIVAYVASLNAGETSP